MMQQQALWTSTSSNLNQIIASLFSKKFEPTKLFHHFMKHAQTCLKDDAITWAALWQRPCECILTKKIKKFVT